MPWQYMLDLVDNPSEHIIYTIQLKLKPGTVAKIATLGTYDPAILVHVCLTN
jgi:hypothetical protein